MIWGSNMCLLDMYPNYRTKEYFPLSRYTSVFPLYTSFLLLVGVLRQQQPPAVSAPQIYGWQ